MNEKDCGKDKANENISGRDDEEILVADDEKLMIHDRLPQNDPPLLSEYRQHWKLLLDKPLSHGDIAYIVPKSFIDRAMALDADSVLALSHLLGPLDFTSVVDAQGNMYDEETDLTEVSAISTVAFECLVESFQIIGPPVTRVMIQQQTGQLTIERHTPVFVVHTVSAKPGPTTRYGGYHDSPLGKKETVLLSQLSTFADLILVVTEKLYKDRSIYIRLWFITSDNIESVPLSLTAQEIVEFKSSIKLVCPGMLNEPLCDHGITSSRLHVVAEPADRHTNLFPVDSYLSNVAKTPVDVDQILHSGGDLGLANLGNTCYMNSALQCLVHIPELNHYFFFNLFENDLNKLNPLGCNGEIALSFSGLLHKLFDLSAKPLTSVTPRDFKYTVGRYSSMFHGYQQQDSQEFTSWLLDTLHEDLNRIQKKPYIEKPELADEDMGSIGALKSVADTCWKQHKMRNDSVIVDLFTGLYQSTLVCPTCDKRSVTFDPFNDVTLPLPQSSKWYHTFTIVDLRKSATGDLLCKLEVELLKTSNFDDLLAYLSKFLAVDSLQLFLYEIFREFFYKSFQDESETNKFIPISEIISSSDLVCVYIIPHNPVEDIITPVINVVKNEDAAYKVSEPFAFPLFIVLNKSTEAGNYTVIKHKIEEVINIFSKKSFGQISDEAKSDSLGSENIDEAQPLEQTNESIEGNFENFQLRVFKDEGTSRFSLRMRQKFGSVNSDSTSVVHIPQTRPSFGKLPLLLEGSPLSFDGLQKVKEVDLMIIISDEDESDFVHIEHKEVPPSTLKTFDSPQELDSVSISEDGSINVTPLVEEELIVDPSKNFDFDENWDQINPLLSSITELRPDTKVPSSYTEQPDTDAEAEALVTNRLCLVVDWNHTSYEKFFNESDKTWDDIVSAPNPELEENRRLHKLKEKSSISLIDCLRNFSSPEVLGEQDLWYCPRCKDHKRATKTIQIWSTGDILTIHLKRFQTSRSFSNKLNMVVDFPIYGLDISEFVSSTTDEDGLIYDLIAVDNHYGGLGGGHYTAAAKNFRDDKWYYFDDSRVRPIDDPTLTITSAAYLLFYRKRSSKPYVGGQSVESLLLEGRRAYSEKFEKARDQLQRIQKEVDSYKKEAIEQQANNEGGLLLELSDSCANLDFRSLDDDDLYSETVPSTAKGDLQKSGSKNMRSPATAQNLEFEFDNQRKQRLISKDCDEPRSVNINMGLSSSVSNLASPEVSSDEVEDQISLGG